MCIIIDTNTLASVFVKTSANHVEFKPVFDWIVEGKGKVVYGGTRYQNELGKYRGVFAQLAIAKKAVKINNVEVDAEEANAMLKIQHPDFDDQHLVGLLVVSKCKLICSLDESAFRFFRHKLFFNPASRKPKIFRGRSNRDLLSDRNIAEVCRPCAATTNEQKQLISII